MVAGIAGGMFRGTITVYRGATSTSSKHHEFGLFPMISNDFQSIPITFEKI
jgi:hypothetical protein